MRILTLFALALLLGACVTDGYYEDSYYSSSGGYNGVYNDEYYDDYYGHNRRYGYDAYGAFDVRNSYDPYFSLFWGWDYYAYAPYRRGYYAYGFDPFYNPYYGWSGFSYGYGWPYTSFAWGWPRYYGYWRPYRHHHHDRHDRRENARERAVDLRDHGLPAPYANARGRQSTGSYGYRGYEQGTPRYRQGQPTYRGRDARDSARELSRSINTTAPQRGRVQGTVQQRSNTNYQRNRQLRTRTVELAPRQSQPSSRPVQQNRLRSFDRPTAVPRNSSRPSSFGSSSRSVQPVQRSRNLPSSNTRRSTPVRSSAPARSSAPVRSSRPAASAPSRSSSSNSGRSAARGLSRDRD